MIHRKCSRNLKLSFLYLLAFLKIIGNKKKTCSDLHGDKMSSRNKLHFLQCNLKYRKDFRIHNCINCLNTHSYVTKVFSCWDCLFATSHIGLLPTESWHWMISLSAAEVSSALTKLTLSGTILPLHQVTPALP